MLRELLIFILLLPAAFAHTFIIDGNGQALVVLDLKGTGTIDIAVPSDVKEIIVNRGIYFIENNTASIWISENATVIYTTSKLTSGSEEYSFVSALPAKGKVTAYLPLDAKIIKTIPDAIVQKTDYTKITWKETEHIQIRYVFKTEISQNNPVGAIFGLVVIGFLAIIAGRLMLSGKSTKSHLIKTLSHTEKIIIKLMIKKGRIRKERLKEHLHEKQAETALAQLRRKGIIMIKKDIIYFSRWFDEL